MEDINKTISVLMCKRLDYGRQVLEHIEAAKGSDNWKVYVYCDIPGHKSDVPYRRSKAKVQPKSVYNMAKSFDFVKDVIMAPQPLGLKAATRWALNHVFRVRGSDYNLHVEDDVLLSPDALHYVEQCYPYLNDKVGSATLVGYLDDSNPDLETRKKVDKHVWFNCGWGWAMKKEFFLKNFHRGPDMRHAASWAADINQLFKNEGFYELRSPARKSKNIGRDFPTHMMSKDNGLNCKDVKDDWNGGNHGPIWDWDFSALDD